MGNVALGREGTGGRRPSRIVGLFITQCLGVFNDNAWKQIVIFLAIAAASSPSQGQEHTAIAQIVLMVPLMLISMPAGVLADRLSKRSIIVGTKLLELSLMLAATLVLMVRPEGGPMALGILALLGVQSALFSPSRYGIIPELVPAERLSKANGLLEMGASLSILGGMVAGAGIIQAAGYFEAPLWVAGVLLVGLSVCGLFASLTIPMVLPARSEGGLVSTLRMGWEAIRADRVLRLTVIGQVLVWSIASLVPAPIVPYAKMILGLNETQASLPLVALALGLAGGCVLAGKLSGARVEYGLLPLGALRPHHLHPGLRRHRPQSHRAPADHGLDGNLQRPAVRPAQRAAPVAIAGRPSRGRHRVEQRPGLRRYAHRLGIGFRAGASRRRAPRDVPGALAGVARRLLLGIDAGPRRLLPVPADRTGTHGLSRPDDRAGQRAGAGGGLAGPQSRLVRRRVVPDRQREPPDPVHRLCLIL